MKLRMAVFIFMLFTVLVVSPFSVSAAKSQVEPAEPIHQKQLFSLLLIDGQPVSTVKIDESNKILNDANTMQKEQLINSFNALADSPSTINVTKESGHSYYSANSPVSTNGTRNSLSSTSVISEVVLQTEFIITGNTSPYLYLRIAELNGQKATTVTGVVDLYRSVTELGTYTKVDGINHTFAGSGVYVGASTKKIIPISKTYYYAVRSSGLGLWTDSSGKVTGSDVFVDAEENGIILNKNGVPYPFYYGVDINGWMNAYPPARTDYTAVSSTVNTQLRNEFNNTVRAKFKTWYDTNYGYVDWATTHAEIHHIRPLQYGGNNDYSNLIPLYPDKHSQFTNWWTYY